jgi:lipid-A-disaccharide synthase-like uncharacterized protein
MLRAPMDVAAWFDSPWEILAWIGQACFFVRFLIQWVASERAGESLAPSAFWWMSVAGALLLVGYSLHRAEPIFLVGYLVTLAIYLRNLWMAHRGRVALSPLPAAALALLAWVVLVAYGLGDLQTAAAGSRAWLVVGAVAQTLWSSRFLVQWFLSEHAGRSHFPEAFWWISLAGNVGLLAYAAHVGDPVWIAGLCLGPLVQVRNLLILRRAEPTGDALVKDGGI